MNKNIKINIILIISIVLLIFLNIILLLTFFSNRNLNIVEQNRSKEQLISSSIDNAYLDKSLHLEELNEQYQQGYEDGSANAYEDAFNYHFKVTIPCAYSFSGEYHDEPWSKSSTTSYYIEYNGGTVKTSTLNSPTKLKWSSDVYTGLQLTSANVVIHEKDKFTATFNLKQTFHSSWDGSKTATATVVYDHGTTTYTFATKNWSSGSYDMTMKKNGNATVTIY